ncbi:MAG: YlxM family DNA-binding protein [Lachnospiraceae bacterium]|nr:YlxM family DNA-binding protein [Lachnospiraceae bacterium]MDD7078132.1 YlxM family DNA-binding protein [Lachnospiraceae bacterium]MDY3730724.1 YlxM family DNA-binding protein [Candidatus Choladocola sp.]
MDEVLKQSLLFDFYGELLTEHQRNVYEEVVQNDLSYSEAAEAFGVSRQGIHEIVKRCNKMLEGYEQKLHLVEKFVRIRESVKEIQTLSGQYEGIDKEVLAKEVLSISEKILEEL